MIFIKTLEEIFKQGLTLPNYELKKHCLKEKNMD